MFFYRCFITFRIDSSSSDRFNGPARASSSTFPDAFIADRRARTRPTKRKIYAHDSLFVIRLFGISIRPRTKQRARAKFRASLAGRRAQSYAPRGGTHGAHAVVGRKRARAAGSRRTGGEPAERRVYTRAGFRFN